jgi:hypothetical protein
MVDFDIATRSQSVDGIDGCGPSHEMQQHRLNGFGNTGSRILQIQNRKPKAVSILGLLFEPHKGRVRK